MAGNKRSKRQKKAKVDLEHANFSFGKKRFKKEKNDIDVVIPTFTIYSDNMNELKIKNFLEDNQVLSKIQFMKSNLNEDFDLDEFVESDSGLSENVQSGIDNLIDNSLRGQKEYTFYIDLEHPKMYRNTILLTDNNEMTFKRLFRVIGYSVRDILKDMNKGALDFEPIDALDRIWVEEISVDNTKNEIFIQCRNFYGDTPEPKDINL